MRLYKTNGADAAPLFAGGFIRRRQLQRYLIQSMGHNASAQYYCRPTTDAPEIEMKVAQA